MLILSCVNFKDINAVTQESFDNLLRAIPNNVDSCQR